MRKIDRSGSSLPLYFQIANLLEEQIERGAYKVGARLPNEKQLATEHGVSLITIRGAMRVLIDKRLIVRYAGKGTFVAARLPLKRMWAIGSLNDLVATGMKSKLRMIWRRQVYPAVNIRTKLGFTANEKVFCLRTIRESDGETFMLTDTFHPREIASRLKKSDFTNARSFTRLVISIVEENTGKKAASVKQAISVLAAPQDIARTLNVEAGAPLLVVERDFFDERGELLQAAQAYYRTDHYKYVMHISNIDETRNAANPADNVRSIDRYRKSARR